MFNDEGLPNDQEIPDSGTPRRSARVRSLILSSSSGVLKPVVSNEEVYDTVLVSVVSTAAGVVFASGGQEAGFDVKSTSGVVTLFSGYGSGVQLQLKNLYWASDTGGTAAVATLWCYG